MLPDLDIRPLSRPAWWLQLKEKRRMKLFVLQTALIAPNRLNRINKVAQVCIWSVFY
jgi:hypothetical protein